MSVSSPSMGAGDFPLGVLPNYVAIPREIARWLPPQANILDDYPADRGSVTFSEIPPLRIRPMHPVGMNDRVLNEAIKLRDLVYQDEVGGEHLQFDTLADRFDERALFVNVWSGRKLVYTVRANPKVRNPEESQFGISTQGRYLVKSTREMLFGCTHPDFRRHGLHGMGVALMLWLIIKCRTDKGPQSACVMLSHSATRNTPKLLHLFESLGFRRQNVADVSKGPLTQEELDRNAFACDRGYRERIYLTPWEVDLRDRDAETRAANTFDSYSLRVSEGLGIPLELSLDDIFRTIVALKSQ